VVSTPVFDQVLVRYAVEGGTRVSWRINRLFADPLPHTFTLEGAYGSTPTADFEPIGLPAHNTYYLLDEDKRVHAMRQDFHYRVRLETSRGEYVSPVTSATSDISFRDWRLARDMIRKERLRHEKYTSIDGYLLKRRRYGTRCTVCTDPYTEEVTDSQCNICRGTGLV
jgi:hypothetical protein